MVRALAGLLVLLSGCEGTLFSLGGSGSPTPADDQADAGACVESPRPVRVWALSRAELDATLHSALSFDAGVAQERLGPEIRGNGFVANPTNAQVDSVRLSQLSSLAEDLAHQLAPQERGPGCALEATALNATCARAWAAARGRRLFRRPLTAEELDDLLALYQVGIDNPLDGAAPSISGVEVVLTALLESPHFLYRTELGVEGSGGTVALTQHELASAVSYLLTGGPPDDELAALADAQALTADALDRQLERLLASSRGAVRLREVTLQWAGVDEVTAHATNDGLTQQVLASMREETARTVDEVLAAGGGYEALLTWPTTHVDAPLATFYGIPAPSQPGFSPVPARVPGLLGQGSWLVASVPAGAKALLHRGNLVRTRLLCDGLPAFAGLGLPDDFKPPAVAPLRAGESMRAHLEANIPQGSACASCHQFFMPLGYAFEGFDAAGRARTSDNGAPIDTSGSLLWSLAHDPSLGTITDTRHFTSQSFTGPAELSALLARRPEARGCFARGIERYLVGRADLPANECSSRTLSAQFTEGAELRAAFRAVVRSTEFVTRVRP